MKKILSMMLVLVAMLAIFTVPANAAEIALVTDVGTIDDESFNQACWQGVEAYATANNISYRYYQPAADSDDERLGSIDQAVADGAKIVVLPGYLFGATVAQAQELYPEVKFVAIDVSAGDLGTEPMENLYCAVFGEEQAGYLAGYAAVKDGFTKLGFLGGMAVPAVQRYGYGFVQGANDAAVAMGTPIEINYTYGGQFYGDANITAKMDGWYTAGTELVFACGGGIWTSAVEAALAHKGYVIGVDVDQHYLGETYVADYGYNPFVSSAMKQLQNATEVALAKFYDGQWETIGGKIETLDLSAGEFIGLPTAETSWCFKNFTVEEYNKLLEDIKSGAVTISNAIDVAPTTDASVTVNYIE
ncbi:MAG: BMP family ABC transporter substrate-binding protein [Christensenellales bacterium]|nr:BMP family ABC transporter substrate-binding protein [Christensenellales bacterium]